MKTFGDKNYVLQKRGKPLRFIDLFAGLGGFHLALQKFGCECVFASEMQEELQEIYEKNFGLKCSGNINDVNLLTDIPMHDILCAGFPCQPFSQAGKQEGFKDQKDRGNLFYKIMDILKIHKPEFVFLENVPNLKAHDNGNTYKVIFENLSELYDVRDAIISPHYLGIPQHRSRIYIVGRLKCKGGLAGFEFPTFKQHPTCSIKTIVCEDDPDYMSLKPITRTHLEAWEEFIKLAEKNNVDIPTFPIWAMEFGATYDFEGLAPYYQKRSQLAGKLGKFGNPIQGNSKDDELMCLPIYAQTNKVEKNRQFPGWKKDFIRWNRKFYLDNKSWIDTWIGKIKGPGFENSHQKFEWNCGKDPDVTQTLYDKIIQFRPSGIRVKLPTLSPALVLTTTQIPILPWVITPTGEKGRYMTRKEAAALQCMSDLKYSPETCAKAFRAFGNAVNVDVVRCIAEKLLEVSRNGK